MSNSPRLAIQQMDPGTMDIDQPFNNLVRKLEQVLNVRAISASTAAEPLAPTTGDLYILPASPTGTNWAGKAAGTLALFDSGTWYFNETPKGFIIANVADTGAVIAWSGAAWVNIESLLGLKGTGATNAWNLRRTLLALRRLRALYTQQVGIALIGDSWLFRSDRIVNDFTRQMVGAYGAAGVGYIGFWRKPSVPNDVAGNADSDAVTVTLDAGWDIGADPVASPDLGETTATVAGSLITVDYLAGNDVTGATLHYVGGVGVIRYRWNGGSWANFDTAGSGVLQTALTGFPTGLWTLEIENVSGTTRLCGLNLESAESGVTIHKIVRNGARTTRYTVVDATQWQTAVATLDAQAFIICLGTNDQLDVSLADFETNLQEIIDRIRAIDSTKEILILAPCENFEGRPDPMAGYTAVSLRLAVLNNCAFADLQTTFGEDYEDLFEDTVHPGPGSGGTLIADQLLRTFQVGENVALPQTVEDAGIGQEFGVVVGDWNIPMSTPPQFGSCLASTTNAPGTGTFAGFTIGVASDRAVQFLIQAANTPRVFYRVAVGGVWQTVFRELADRCPRIQTAASGNGGPSEQTDMLVRTALAAAITIAAPSVTFQNGQRYMFRLRDNGTGRAITWNGIYRSMTATLPATTVANKTLYCEFIYNADEATFDLLNVAQQP